MKGMGQKKMPVRYHLAQQERRRASKKLAVLCVAKSILVYSITYSDTYTYIPV